MAIGESIGLKAAWHVFPLFIGATAALFLNPPKHRWAIPILLIVFMAIGEFLGPILQENFSMLSKHPAASHIIAAALGWSLLKLLQKMIGTIEPSSLIPAALSKKEKL
jgi:hypothetical protein